MPYMIPITNLDEGTQFSSEGGIKASKGAGQNHASNIPRSE